MANQMPDAILLLARAKSVTRWFARNQIFEAALIPMKAFLSVFL